MYWLIVIDLDYWCVCKGVISVKQGYYEGHLIKEVTLKR